MNNQPKLKCVICKKEIEGYGHNPSPVKFTGRCCDECNTKYVLAARKLLMNRNNPAGSNPSF